MTPDPPSQEIDHALSMEAARDGAWACLEQIQGSMVGLTRDEQAALWDALCLECAKRRSKTWKMNGG